MKKFFVSLVLLCSLLCSVAVKDKAGKGSDVDLQSKPEDFNQIDDEQFPTGQTIQPAFQYATENPRPDQSSHTTGPVTVRSTTIQYFDELTSSYISLGPSDVNDDSSSEENSDDVINTTMSAEKLKQMCMTMPVQSQLWSTICEGILSVIVGICGLMGNGATIAVLSRPTFRETFHKLLICLSCFDSLFIGCALLIYAIRAHALHLSGESLIHYMFMILYPLGNVALYGSIYLTLAVSIERFLGLVYPVQSRTRPRRHLLAYLLPVIIFSVAFNIPKALEFRLFTVKKNNETHVEAGESEWARDVTYTHYYKVWSNLILTAVLPLIVLVFCNGAIFLVLRKSRKAMIQSKQTSNNTSGCSGGNRTCGLAVPTQHNGATLNVSCCNGRHSRIPQTSTSCNSSEYSLALILAAIVLVFMVCHACRFFLAFYQVSVAQRTSSCIENGMQAPQPEWLYMLSAINHLMLMVNSSVNFIIYCAVGSRFRRALTCPLLGGASNRRPRYHAGAHWAGGQNNSNQIQNQHSCNNGSEISNRKFVRVVWRKGRPVSDEHDGQDAVAIVDGSQILGTSQDQRKLVTRITGDRHNRWRDHSNDIGVVLTGGDISNFDSDKSTKVVTRNGKLCNRVKRNPSWSDEDLGRPTSPPHWFRVKAEVNLDLAAICHSPPANAKQPCSPIKACVKSLASFTKSTSGASNVDLMPLNQLQISEVEESEISRIDFQSQNQKLSEM